MKAKYKYNGTYGTHYEQVYCMDNVFVAVTTYEGSTFKGEAETRTEVCLTNAEARHMFFEYCNKLEKNGYKCIYKEVK